MFTPLDNKAVINSYSALRHEREMYAVIRKENVCVCVCVIPQVFKTNVNPEIFGYRYGRYKYRGYRDM